MSPRRFFDRLSLRQRLVAVIFAVSAATSITGFAIHAFRDVQDLRQAMTDQAVVVARAAASYSVTDLLFNDERTAKKALATLASLPSLQDAFLFGADGRVFASLHDNAAAGPAPAAAPQAEFRGGLLHVVEPIAHQGRPLGSVVLTVATDRLWAEIAQTLATLALLLAVVLAISLGLALWLQGVVSEPILHLAGTARRMSAEADFSTRVTPPSSDEIGTLYQAFNALLDRVQRHAAERTAAYAELADREARIRLLLDSTAEAIYGADVDGICTFVNPACLRMLGYAHESDLVGKSIHELIHHTYPDGRPYPKEQCRARVANLRGEAAHADDEVHWRADGTSFPVEYWSHPMVHDGRLTGAVVTFVDITERRRADDRLRQLNEELELRVARRTAELLAARDVAEQASRAKTDFLSRMSHELRTPLNAILGFAQILCLHGAATDAAQRDEYVGQIERAGWHLLELINEVLDLSRIESGTMVISREPVSLQQLCGECVMLVQPLARTAGIELVDHGAQAEPLSALADRTRLNQVLMNLLSNAVKYNRPGGTVTLALRATGDQVELSVADTGPGFSAQQLSQLYQPFNRLGAENGKTEGTGIGLVITKRLTELMGGTLELSTREGEGSHFTLRLARARPDATGGGPSPPAPPVATPTGGARSVLYIEDNPSNVDLVRSVLALRPGIKLAVARDGLTGLVMADIERPDLVLVDIALPDIDGYHVCTQLRSRADGAGLLIIALSANAMPADIERGRQAGFDAYLTKPLDIHAFLAQLDRLLA